MLAALGFSGRLSRSAPHPQTLQTTARSVYERGLIKRDISSREILAVSSSLCCSMPRSGLSSLPY